ncbi:hypothetical protein [Marinomonas sp. IMCC 4694]|uniref:hypothetical protein n=1 Tax=Marinomonas sp. IMCC 4694 TaxID=2605432 RepID=UPI0011E8A137|nr:hypothetical protein [Marinomonas sp. IMCC 4694]TYL48713.1 hypothetical protein FXV75_12700 [Marinomonas sp. IMCC 4694]
MLELLLSIVSFFFLLVALMVFFIRHQSKIPYYNFTQSQCVDLLGKAIHGRLPECEWHAFIGMSVRGNDALDALREQCSLIDESGVKGTQRREGRLCMVFNKQGVDLLESLYDEWLHKSDCLI